jgi:hypothetical protein
MNTTVNHNPANEPEFPFSATSLDTEGHRIIEDAEDAGIRTTVEDAEDTEGHRIIEDADDAGIRTTVEDADDTEGHVRNRG